MDPKKKVGISDLNPGPRDLNHFSKNLTMGVGRVPKRVPKL